MYVNVEFTFVGKSPDEAVTNAIKHVVSDVSEATVILVAFVADVAVDAFPVRAAVMVPAVKLPDASLATIALAVLALAAVVAEFETLDAVDIVANLVSTIPADALISAFTIIPAAKEEFHVPLVIVPTCVRDDPVIPAPSAEELRTVVPPIL